MKLTKYAPASPLDLVLDRAGFGFPLFDRILTEGNGHGWDSVRLPKTNIQETEDSYLFTLEMPGLTRDQVEVNLESDVLVVKGSRSEEKKDEKGVLRREFHATCFERSFKVGDAVDREKIRAKMENGILTVTLPKAPEKVGRKIEIA